MKSNYAYWLLVLYKKLYLQLELNFYIKSNIEELNEKYNQKLREFEDQANEETTNAKKRPQNVIKKS
jgi:hypothetical protein